MAAAATGVVQDQQLTCCVVHLATGRHSRFVVRRSLQRSTRVPSSTSVPFSHFSTSVSRPLTPPADGTLVAVGLPPDTHIKANVFFTVFKALRIVGSYVGNRQDAIEALDFASRGKVTPLISIEPLENLQSGECCFSVPLT